jgi:hypothetical protein
LQHGSGPFAQGAYPARKGASSLQHHLFSPIQFTDLKLI